MFEILADNAFDIVWTRWAVIIWSDLDPTADGLVARLYRSRIASVDVKDPTTILVVIIVATKLGIPQAGQKTHQSQPLQPQ